MLGAGTLEKHMSLHYFHSPIPWGLNCGLIPYTLSVVTMQSSLIERLIWCLQLVYFLVKPLNVRRYNSCFVINNSLPSNHLLSYCLILYIDIWSAAIKDLLPCFFLPNSIHPLSRGHLRTSGVGTRTIDKELYVSRLHYLCLNLSLKKMFRF